LDDCASVHLAALANRASNRLVVGGVSAGANLAAALVLRARDNDLPLPAALALVSPELDLTESGDSFATLAGTDVMLVQSLMPANLLYAGGHDLSEPYLSPLFGDFGRGFPPTFLSAGTRDLFLSNAVRMHRRLRQDGIPTELHVFEAMPHGGFTGETPEDAELWSELRAFMAERWA
jgi:acetyl esterase/lipase